MKRIISILFILLMSVQMLPALVDVDQRQRTVLASTTEEETHGHVKCIKEKKEFKDLVYVNPNIDKLHTSSTAYIHANTTLTEAPFLGINTPPPNRYC